MKKVWLFLALFLACPVDSAEFKSADLEGAWLIVSMGGMADDEGDVWEFENGLFYQNLGGRRIAPDKYTIKDNIIDLDGYHIKVLKFTGNTMTADMAGFVYELKKK